MVLKFLSKTFGDHALSAFGRARRQLIGRWSSDNFTVLRLVLAGTVVFVHSRAALGLEGPMWLGRNAGTLAVQCFFVISGYLVTGSYLNTDSAAKFALKRFLRIAPALFVAYWFGNLVWQHFDRFADNPLPYVNASLWTLSWEVVCYVMVLLVGMAGLLNRNTLGAAYLSGLVLLFCTLNEQSTTQLVVAGFFVLFAGGAMIRLSEQEIDVRACGILATVALAFLYVPTVEVISASALEKVAFIYGPAVSFGMLRWYASLIALPFAVIVLARYFPVSFPIKNDYSYGLYVFAWPVQQVVVWYSLKWQFPIGPIGLFLVSGSITLALAVASWHLLEKPALHIFRPSERQGRKNAGEIDRLAADNANADAESLVLVQDGRAVEK
jgi:peptidoglycan/LPS O-acetylase OafA/YrhL